MSARLLAPPLVAGTLAAGVWFWSGVVAPDYWTAIGLGVAWFVACSVLFGRLGTARPELRWWLRGTFLACSAAALAGFWWTSIRETEVNERVVTGVPASALAATDLAVVDPLAPRPGGPAARTARRAPRVNVVVLSGAVEPRSHSASGRARIVRLPGGKRKLTLSDGFRIDPGPQVRVYLATDASAATFEDLGELKGSKGTQQYEIAAGTSLRRYDTVVFWCVPFSVALASADLRPA
jgi:hypothetical protein